MRIGAAPAQPGVALQVVGMQRLLQPGQIERLELPGPADRGRRVPAQAGIHHQFDVRRPALPGRAHLGDVALLALAHRPPAELDGPEALADQFAADALRLGRRVAEQDGGVGAELLAEAAAQQLVDRPFRRLADDVPQGDLDAAHRLDDRSLPAEEDRAFVHAVDEAIDLEGILADDALGQAAANLVRQRRSMIALATSDDESASPTPTRPASVWTLTTSVSWLPSQRSLTTGRRKVDGLDAGDFHRCSLDFARDQ